ncbi:hypothetical protein F975_02058 [Acinetobacter sp. ANC 3789]|uniref:hypothetical protein n=1 Tax=Acinetobacter sp. ANC 3789 TaxID=1217714 RepID=UPI0002CF6671|nr:hypothetical protein [Acinetobacter sp. ANC 3789]ENU80302.1 hypothetical protein F975_02058 [Acinetobacter sp. ANC 3789]
MKLIDLHHILYPMVTYDLINIKTIHYNEYSDMIIFLDKINDQREWCMDIILRDSQRYSLFFKTEYLACLKFLKFSNKIVSDIPSEMKVLDFSEGKWYLLEKNEEFYFNVQYDLNYYNYSWNMKLNLKEISNYRLSGRTSLDQLCQEIYSSQPFYEDSIFYFRKINVKLSSEDERAIIRFNNKKPEYVDLSYKIFEKCYFTINKFKDFYLKENYIYLFCIIVVVVGVLCII